MKSCILLLLIFFSKNVFSQVVSAKNILEDSITTVNGNGVRSKILIKNLQKKYIILDFWATWCKPCIDNHKNLEALYESNRDSLAVVTLSGDKAGDFSRFNTNWSTSLIRAIDPEQVIFKKYKVSLVPTMFLVNTQTMNIRIINGGLITNKLFKDFIGSELRKTENVQQMADPQEIRSTIFKTQPKDSRVKESPYIPTSPSFAFYQIPDKNLYVRRLYVNFSIPGVYKDCLAFTEVRCIYKYEEKLEAYSCFELSVRDKDKNKILPNKLMLDYLKKNHPNINAKIIDKVSDSCYFLESIGNKSILPVSKSVSPKDNTRGSSIEMRKVTLDKLCSILEEQFKVPIENKFDLKKMYDFSFQYEYGNIESLNAQLKKFGLVMKLKKNKVLKFLEFDKTIVSL